jgi:hypothetical protein
MVLAYAILDESIPHSGRGSLVVNGKRLGRVPRLAIARLAADVLLLHCSPTWKVLGTAAFASADEAERSAERTYPGISRKWQRTRVTKRQAEAFLKALWKGQSAASPAPARSGRKDRWRGGVRICDICIREIRRR